MKSSKATRVWLPAALISETPFQKTLSNAFRADGGKPEIVKVPADGLGIVIAEFPASVRPVLTLTSRVATKNHAVDFSVASKAPEAPRAELDYFHRLTKMRYDSSDRQVPISGQLDRSCRQPTLLVSYLRMGS